MFERLAVAIAASALALVPFASHTQTSLVTELDLALPDTVGGLSAIELDETGTQAVLLSDRGTLYRARITRDTAGEVIGFELTGTQRLRHTGEHKHPDSEGLAALTQTDFAVSAEDPTRLLFYRWGNKDPSYIPDTPTHRPLDTNRGFEALARAPDGALWTFFETPEDDVHTAWIFADGAWRAGPSFPSTPSFSIVGADFDRDGRLYVLERAFSLLGFRTQIRRVTFDGNRVEQEMILQTGLGRFDNLEGLAVSRTPNGQTRLTMVSDNNNLSILRMSLVEFVLTE